MPARSARLWYCDRSHLVPLVPAWLYGDPNTRLIAVLLAAILFAMAGGLLVVFVSR